MENALHSCVHALKDTWHLGTQMSHLSVQTKLDSFFRPALLRSKTSTSSESSTKKGKTVPVTGREGP
jgi:hypothetical protein